MAERFGHVVHGAVLVAVLAVAVRGFVSSDAARAQSPLPERRGLVANGTSMAVSEARLEAEFSETIGEPYGLDGLVLVVEDCRPDPEVYLDQALVAYGLAPRAGAMYDDALAWLVCLEPRFTGFFFASDNPYAGGLDAPAATDVMVQPLRDGNFTGAFTASMARVADQLAVGAGGAQAEGDRPAGGDARPSDSPSAAAPERGEDGGLPWLPWAAAAAAAGGAALWWRRRGASRPEEAGTGPPSSLRAFERRLDDLGSRLTPESGAVARLVLAYEAMGDEAMLEVHRRHQAMVERLAVLQSKSAQLRSEAAAEESVEAEGVDRLEEAIAELAALEAYVEEIEREADHVERLESDAPVLLVDARKAIDAAREAYGRESEPFDLPPADRALAVAARLADEGEVALTAGQRIVAGRAAEGAMAVSEAVGALPHALHEADATVDEAAAAFPRLERYAEQSWADVRGNGSEAEESLDAAVTMFARVVEADPSSFGPDAAAGFLDSLDRVHGEIARARRLAETVRERLAFLDRAREQSQESIAAVEAEIAAGRAWIARPDIDPDVSTSPEQRLAAAEALLAETRLDMSGPMPDWIAVMRAVNEADRMAEEAVAAARSEHEAIGAKRRQAEAARTDAVAAVERAVRYLSAHGRDVPADAPARVAEARESLASADRRSAEAERVEDGARASGLRDAAEAYAAARLQAEAAYEMMAAAVARAERERRAYVPRGTWMGPFVPVPGRPRPFYFDLGGMGGSHGRREREDRPARPSGWGSRPSGSGAGGRPSGGSSSRRGGGRGW